MTDDENLRDLNDRIAAKRRDLAAAGRLVTEHVPSSHGVASAAIDAQSVAALVAYAEAAAARVSPADRGAFLGGQFAAALARGMEELGDRCKSRNIDPRGELTSALMGWDPDPEAWRSLSAAVAGGARLILIGGSTGAGKSSLAAYVVVWHRTPSDPQAAPMFISAARLAEALAMPYDDVRRRIKARAERTPAIAIDDFGRRSIPKEHMEALSDYLCTAVTRGVRVVLTSNMQPRELKASLFFDPLLRDRAERYTHLIFLNVPSRRQRAKGAA